MEKILRCAIYIRVSTWEQAVYGKSLRAQKECLEEYASKHGMKVVGVFADEGQTARKELKKRKAIHALLAEVKQDKIDIILFWRMDRWFRSVGDFYKVQDVLDAHSTRWIDVGEPNINMETRDGRLSLNLALAIGQNEVDTTSERIKFTVNNTIKNGGLVWGKTNLGLGYKIEEVNGKNQIVKDPETAPMVEEFYRYIFLHQNKCATVKYMQETFGIPFSYTMLRTLCFSELYAGAYRGNENYCPAYITREQLQKLREITKNYVRSAPSGRVYVFSGLMRCPLCGQKLAGTGQKSIINRKTGEKREYIYYRCNRALIDKLCPYRHLVSQNLIETYLLEHIQEEYEKFQLRAAVAKRTIKKAAPKKSPEKIRQEMERLNLMYQKGRIQDNYYEEEYQRLERELQETNIIPLPQPAAVTPQLQAVLSDEFQSIYQALTPENRKALWRNVIREIHLTEAHQVEYVDFW